MCKHTFTYVWCVCVCVSHPEGISPTTSTPYLSFKLTCQEMTVAITIWIIGDSFVGVSVTASLWGIDCALSTWQADLYSHQAVPPVWEQVVFYSSMRWAPLRGWGRLLRRHWPQENQCLSLEGDSISPTPSAIKYILQLFGRNKRYNMSHKKRQCSC